MVDYARVSGWTKASRLPAGKSSLFDMQKLFIPINQGNVHWVLVVVDMNGGGDSSSSGAKEVSFFDSFGRDGTTYIEVRSPPPPTPGTKGRQLSELLTAGIAPSCLTAVDLCRGWSFAPRFGVCYPSARGLAVVSCAASNQWVVVWASISGGMFAVQFSPPPRNDCALRLRTFLGDFVCVCLDPLDASGVVALSAFGLLYHQFIVPFLFFGDMGSFLSAFLPAEPLFCMFTTRKQAVQQYLVSELSHRDKTRQEQFVPRTLPPANAPRQHNSSDCGVLMLHVMEVCMMRCDVAAQVICCRCCAVFVFCMCR